ncbi:MAG: elongation factor G, partial [Ruminococcaceae bacterium]|nr:elongation factor G [Oscillospiraceae bacterium]
MNYESKNIRNVALLGHGNTGKTTLAESMLFMTGAIDRQGKITDGNTVCDYDTEEIKRQITISSAVAPVEYAGCKINVLDCPGYFDFAGEVSGALRAVEAGIILCSAKDGISVGAERCWKTLKAANIPTMLCVSKIDEEHGDFAAVLAAMKEKYGSIVCPVTAPMSDGSGIIDLVHNVAYKTAGGKRSECPIPAADQAAVDSMREALMETAAGADEELMEKYFESLELCEADIVKGLKIGMKDRSVVPVVASSAVTGLGTLAILQAIADYVPAPTDMDGIKADAPTAGFVFKTVSDQFGKYSFVKVMNGKITADMSLRNVRASSTDKLGRLYTMCGKKATEVKEACCGDIVAVGKMEWKTGDTVCDPKNEVEFPAVEIAEPCYSMAIAPKTKGQDDKVGTGLARLNEEDISFTLVNNAETHQMVISGAGDIQVDVLCAKLKSRFGVDVELLPAKVAYREKIKGRVEAHGRHKKQSGGSGQFGDVWVRFEPQDETDDLIFAEEVFGGSVPKNFFPSVEKGLRNAVQKGVLAGYPLVGLKATLYDGSYHPVDSND